MKHKTCNYCVQNMVIHYIKSTGKKLEENTPNVKTAEFEFKDSGYFTLAGWLSWLEHCPVNPKGCGFNLGPGAYLVLRFQTLVRSRMGGNRSMFLSHINVCLSVSVKSIKHILKWGSKIMGNLNILQILGMWFDYYSDRSCLKDKNILFT